MVERKPFASIEKRKSFYGGDEFLVVVGGKEYVAHRDTKGDGEDLAKKDAAFFNVVHERALSERVRPLVHELERLRSVVDEVDVKIIDEVLEDYRGL